MLYAISLINNKKISIEYAHMEKKRISNYVTTKKWTKHKGSKGRHKGQKAIKTYRK